MFKTQLNHNFNQALLTFCNKNKRKKKMSVKYYERII